MPWHWQGFCEHLRRKRRRLDTPLPHLISAENEKLGVQYSDPMSTAIQVRFCRQHGQDTVMFPYVHAAVLVFAGCPALHSFPGFKKRAPKRDRQVPQTQGGDPVTKLTPDLFALPLSLFGSRPGVLSLRVAAEKKEAREAAPLSSLSVLSPLTTSSTASSRTASAGASA
jgi:hypothetical protein